MELANHVSARMRVSALVWGAGTESLVSPKGVEVALYSGQKGFSYVFVPCHDKYYHFSIPRLWALHIYLF